MSQQQIFQATEPQDTQVEAYYEYEPLPDGRFARYLILQPGSTVADPLSCTLHTAHLDEFPSFEAVSYVWGIPIRNRAITCNGKVIRITTNLDDALRQVRLTEKPRALWVDSVCINQADPKEKGYQVSLMEQVYKKSSCTLICLGASDHVHAPVTADLVADVDNLIQEVCAGRL